MKPKRSVSLEEFADLLCSEFGEDEANRMVLENMLPIRYLREQMGLVFSRDPQGKLSISRLQ